MAIYMYLCSTCVDWKKCTDFQNRSLVAKNSIPYACIHVLCPFTDEMPYLLKLCLDFCKLQCTMTLLEPNRAMQVKLTFLQQPFMHVFIYYFDVLIVCSHMFRLIICLEKSWIERIWFYVVSYIKYISRR